MTLRTPNNPNTSIVVMQTLRSLLPVDTKLAETSVSGNGRELIYIQEKYKMALGMTTIPIAVNMYTSSQERYRDALRAYSGLTTIEVCYYTRIDSQDVDFDALWAAMDTDIERMAANVESNDTTEYAGANHTLSLERLTIAPYEPELDTSIPNFTLLKRDMSLTFSLLPYSI